MDIYINQVDKQIQPGSDNFDQPQEANKIYCYPKVQQIIKPLIKTSESNFQIIVNNHNQNKKIENKQLKTQVNHKNIKKQIKKRQRLNQKKLFAMVKQFQNYSKEKRFEDSSKLKLSKLSLTQISHNFNFSRSTVYKLYNQYIYDSTLAQRLLMLGKESRKKSIRQLNRKRMQSLKNILNDNPYLTQWEIVQKLNMNENLKKKGKQIQRRAIGRLLKMMNYTKKKVIKIFKYRNTPENIKRRFQYCVFYKSIKQKNRSTYFLGEIFFNLYTIRDMAWSERGHPFEPKIALPTKDDISIVAILGEQGVLMFETIKGGFTKESYLNFFNEFLNSFEKKNGIQKSYIVADNCQIYDYLETEGILFKSNNIDMICLPPHSPQLNPIDCWFHQLKAKVRKSIFTTPNGLLQQVLKAIKPYLNFDFTSYFKVAMIHVESGAKKQLF